jgi:hypothetical protein
LIINRKEIKCVFFINGQNGRSIYGPVWFILAEFSRRIYKENPLRWRNVGKKEPV